MKIFTHQAYVIGNDARTPKNYRRLVKLRETKKFWVDESGIKFQKSYLTTVGDWPMYRLENEPKKINT